MPTLSAFANPARFLRLARVAAPLLYAVGLGLVAYGLWQGLWRVPPDMAQGGDIMRVMFIHVPAAWMAMACYAALAGASLVWFVWRHELADLAAQALAPIGAVYTAVCLLTGSVWGKPTWGTWWQWEDPRMMSVLFLLFLYIGYMALRAAMDTRLKAAWAGAILAMAGVVNLPLIRFSVELFASLHQGPSVIREGGPAMDAVYLTPLLLSGLGHLLLVGGLTVTLMQAGIFERRAAVLRARALAAG